MLDKDMEDPPCDKYLCDNFYVCGSDLLACKAFHFYVTSGRSTNPRGGYNIGPNKQIYDKIYNIKEDDDASIGS